MKNDYDLTSVSSKKVDKTNIKWYELFNSYHKNIYTNAHTFFIGDIEDKTILKSDYKTLLSKAKRKKDIQDDACFRYLCSFIKEFYSRYNKLPDYIVYDLSFSKSHRNLNDLELYLKLCNKENLFGEKINCSDVIKYGRIIIKLLGKYDENQLYFILSNIRTVQEHWSVAEFVIWAYRNYNIYPSVSMIIYTYFINGWFNHHYLNIQFSKQYNDNFYYGSKVISYDKKDILQSAWKLRNFLKIKSVKPYSGLDFFGRGFQCSNSIKNLVCKIKSTDYTNKHYYVPEEFIS